MPGEVPHEELAGIGGRVLSEAFGCVGGDDLTVSAVQHGKVAAIAIDRSLSNG